MMYRRNSARQPRIDWRAALAALDFKSMAQRLVYAVLESTGLYEQAHRENRQYTRWHKRNTWYTRASKYGLNGPRAVARRRRQIEDGQITVSNGLVIDS